MTENMRAYAQAKKGVNMTEHMRAYLAKGNLSYLILYITSKYHLLDRYHLLDKIESGIVEAPGEGFRSTCQPSEHRP